MTKMQRIGLVLFISGVVSFWGTPDFSIPCLIAVFVGVMLFTFGESK